MKNYPVYKIKTGHTLLCIGRNRTTGNYVVLVKESKTYNEPGSYIQHISINKQNSSNIETIFAIEYDSSSQVDAYIKTLQILSKHMKKEGL